MSLFFAILKLMKVSGLDDTIAWYNQNAEQYAKINAGVADVDQIEELSNLLPHSAKILDAGCAAGRDSILFHEKGFDVTGVDISTGLLAVARRTYPQITFLEANFLELPFESNKFDAIWSHQSLLHLEKQDDVSAALAEFHRVLKSDGVLLVLVKSQMGTNKTAVVSDAFSGHDRFFQYFTKDEISSLLTKSGFDVFKLEEYREIDKNPSGRPEVGLIYSLSRKASN